MSWNQDAKCGIYIYECTPINIDTMRYIYASLSNEYFLEDECYRKLLQKRIEAYVDDYYSERICSSCCSGHSGCSGCSGCLGCLGCLGNSGRSCSRCSCDFDDSDGSVYCLNGFICPGCLEYLASQYSDCYEDSECSDARPAILMVCDA